MNKLLMCLGAFLLWKLFSLDQQIQSSEAAVLDIMQDVDDTVSKNISDTAAHMANLYAENTYLCRQLDLLTLDYLNHLSEYKHLDAMTDRPVVSEPYILDSITPTALEISLRKQGIKFKTRRPKGA